MTVVWLGKLGLHGRNECPMFAPRCACPDPLGENLNFLPRQLASGIRWRHHQVRVVGSDALQQMTLGPQNLFVLVSGQLLVEPQLPLPLRVIRPVAAVTGVSKNRLDVVVEIYRGADWGEPNQ